MFLPRKIYCRVFQEEFHMAIPFLPYRKPALLHHTDALVPLLGRKGISRILLVTEPVVRGNQITQPLEQSLKQVGISCIVYDQTVSNPTTDQVEEARALYNAHHCQAIIGFGGGSSMDCAQGCGGADCPSQKNPGQNGRHFAGMEKTPLAHCHSHHCRNRQ